MNEKLTDRIGVISLVLYTISFFAQIICTVCKVDIIAQLIIFILCNVFIITCMSVIMEEHKKLFKLIKVLAITIISDIFLAGVCLIAYGISIMI